jgi:hypothetical protein
VYNALAAIAICRHFKVDEEAIKKALLQAKVKGRIEMIKVSDQFTLLIDYAHNAMALESLLTTLLIAAVLGGDYYIITKSGIQFSSVLVVLIMAAAVLVICTTLYVFPVLAKFDNTIMGTIRNAFIMSILQLPKTLVMLVMAFFPLIIYLVSLRLIPIIFLFGFSLPAYASAMLYNKFFQKLEDQLVSEQEPAPEVSPEEDERVFHDEIDESIKIEDK